MLVLFETPAGYAIFKLLDENKLAKSENLYEDFETPEAASKIVTLQYFHKFKNTVEALGASTALVEGKLCKSLKKTLKKCCPELQEQLAVADAKLGSAIKDKLHLSCVSNTSVQELMRCIRSQMDSLVTGVAKKEMTAMALGLAHSLSRYKLKFSPDKIDTMVIQAVCLLDELDKELNNYIMRAREWYGWHFPELGKIVTNNLTYIKTMKTIGQRENTKTCDLSDILTEDIEQKVKKAAETSIGSEISKNDAEHMQFLCAEIIELDLYRSQLYDYLKARMMALAPNLAVLVGELIGARLISKAGSLTNLAKHPASTLQILGAEKALFRALKSKRNTPKYGLIYHSQLVGQSSNKNKGKMSRMLAAKASLASRVDALGETTSCDLGVNHKVKLEERLRQLEAGNMRRISGTAKAKAKFEKYHTKNEFMQYSTSVDSTLPNTKLLIQEIEETKVKVEVKEEVEEPNDSEEPKKKKKKKKKHEPQAEDAAEAISVKEDPSLDPVPKKKKKRSSEHLLEDTNELNILPKKKKRSLEPVPEEIGEASGAQEEVLVKIEQDTKKKEKKKKKHEKETESSGMDEGPKKKSKKKSSL